MTSGQKIGKYEVLEKIGRGGFGEVFKGRDPFIKRLVAIKTCTSENQDLRKRFLREAEIAGNLHHPNVTLVYEFGFEEDVPYLVQEYLTGEDLDRKIKRREGLTLNTKIDYAVQIAEGLEYAHSKGVIHRDIKPGNIRVLDDGVAKIMDFGIGKLAYGETQLTRTGTTIGTPEYLAPEQLRGEQLDPRADIFSYGLVIYELLSYQHPFRSDNLPTLFFKLLNHTPQPLTELAPSCPPELDRIVARCLEKDRDERYSSTSDLLAELRPLAEEVRTASQRMDLETTLVAPRKPAVEKPAPSEEALEQDAAQIRAHLEVGELEKAQAALGEALSKHGEAEALAALRQRLEELQRQERQARVQELVRRAQDFVGSRQLEVARKALLQAVEIDPEADSAVSLLAQVEEELQRQKALAKAVKEIEELLDNGELRKARSRLEKVGAAHGDAAELRSLRSRFDEAEQQQRQLRARDLMTRARELLRAEDFRGARKSLKEVLELEPELHEAQELLSQVEEAHERKRALVQVAERIGNLLDDRDLEAAQAALSEAVQAHGEVEPLPALETRLQELQRERREAQIGDLMTQARSLVEAESFDGAREILRRALDLDRKHAEAKELLSRLEEGERRKAEQLAEATRRIKAHLEEGRLDEAAELLAEQEDAHGSVRSLELLRRNLERLQSQAQRQEAVEARLARARGLLQSGDPDAAAGELRQALELDPESSEARSLLSQAEEVLARRQVEEERRRALADEVEAVETFIGKGRVEKAAKRLERAKASFGEAEPLVELAARLEEAAAHEEEEARQAEEARRAGELEELVARARKLMEGDKIDKARRPLEKALTIQADHTPALELLSSVDSILAARAEERERQKLLSDLERRIRKKIRAQSFTEALTEIDAAQEEHGRLQGMAELRAGVVEERQRWEQRQAERAATTVAEVEEGTPSRAFEAISAKRVPRRAVLAVAAILALAVVGGGLWLGRDQGLAPASPGTVVLDAVPWGQVTEIVNADGDPFPVAAEAYTPLILSLPPGRYTVTVSNPFFAEPTSVEIEVGAAELVREVVEVGKVEVDEYFQRMGW